MTRHTQKEDNHDLQLKKKPKYYPAYQAYFLN